MNVKLQILVPHYTEKKEVIKPLLDSIQIQQGIDLDNDIGVIIVNDGSDEILDTEFLDNYTFPIEYHIHEHKGVSATRNACLDYATADYVMFCDADDMFFNACGLWIILREAEKGFDTMVSVFVEEQLVDGKKYYINHERDSTFVHGKVHNRKFLLDNNIRWNDSLTIHEDSYFNILCQTLSGKDRGIYAQSPFYLWKWRDASVCRHDDKYLLKTYNNLLDSNKALVKEFLSRGMDDKAKHFIGLMVFEAYYTMNKPEWINQENKEYRDSVEKHFTEYFAEMKVLWESIPDTQKMQISNAVRYRNVNEGMQMEHITIDDWLKERETTAGA